MRTTTNIHIPHSFEGLVNELFNGNIFAEGDNLATHHGKYPPTNITETETAYHLHLLSPGRQKEDIKINLDKNKLTISFEAPIVETESSAKTIKTEFAIKSFKRVFNINNNIDSETITAKYENGILELVLNKKEVSKEDHKTIIVE
jgi:HSP20 family protein